MKSNGKKVFLSINDQEYSHPNLSINLDAVSMEGEEISPHEIVVVEFLGKRQKFSTNENGVRRNVIAEFHCVQQEIEDKLRAWIEDAEKGATEYDLVSPALLNQFQSMESAIKGAAKKIQDLQQKKAKPKGEVKVKTQWEEEAWRRVAESQQKEKEAYEEYQRIKCVAEILEGLCSECRKAEKMWRQAETRKTEKKKEKEKEQQEQNKKENEWRERLKREGVGNEQVQEGTLLQNDWQKKKSKLDEELSQLERERSEAAWEYARLVLVTIEVAPGYSKDEREELRRYMVGNLRDAFSTFCIIEKGPAWIAHEKAKTMYEAARSARSLAEEQVRRNS